MANSYLNRTPSSAGNRKTFTFSTWIKRASSSVNQMLLVQSSNSSNFSFLRFKSNGTLSIASESGGSSQYNLVPSMLFRDFSAWYHIVLAVDTTQATSSNRIKLYVNGSQVTDFSTETYPSQNINTMFNSTNALELGRRTYATDEFFDGYMSHVAFVDGQALAPTVFGETDSTSGIWKFKSPSGVTWGTNGFHLKMENSAALGTDSSGNSNTFTVNGNLKQAVDTPSNVYATLNPNDVMNGGTGILKPTYSNGNLTMANSANDNRQAFGTISPETGKWYWEMKIDAAVTTGHRIGVFFGNNKTHNGSYYFGANAFYIHQNGEIYYNGSSVAYCASYTAGDIISVALDVTNGNIYISKNGGASDSTWSDGSGNNNQAFPGTSINSKLSASWISGPVTPFFDVYGNGNKQSINFGNGYFGTTAITSAGSNGNGSLFEYDVPSGYYALNTKNINTYG
nr:lectin-like protein [uncultured Mediterranean phage uvMED]